MSGNGEQALYRFYDAAGDLLYIGITFDPGSRWAQHQHDKPWWHEVQQLTVEVHPDRQAVLDAERAAILAERPRYNIVHNTGRASTVTTKKPQRETPVLDRLQPVQVGDFVALGLSSGSCPVGMVAAMDEVWISVRLMDFGWGNATDVVEVHRWADVEQIRAAYREDAEVDDVDGRAHLDTDPLGEFQTAWQRAHTWETHPLAVAVAERRKAAALERRERR